MLTETQVLLTLAIFYGTAAVSAICLTLAFLWDLRRKGPVYRWLERMDEYWEKMDSL